MEALNLSKRMKTICHGTRKERRNGKIPGIIYGKEIGNEMFEVDSLELQKELTATGEHGVITFNMDGKKGTAVIKEVQKSPVEHKIIHLDLEEIAANAKMHTDVSIKIIGKGLLESKGLVWQTQRDLVKVSCIAKDLPKDIELDISNGGAGTVYTFKDLNMGKNVSIVDDISTVIGSISEEERVQEEEETEE
ncbi:50S ribosomal protein L25 [Clostridium saccharobutylicum]|uniref:Large ribosomal subunit protein bL25 n=1 Tax=Clostridium saccharobutylicum TaxID=169679 RepID=A0A1S8NAJ9_CLOSA|nr:50S ribosomal protein L25 [Clostridium saccharobutylicum]OOM13509.1 general stress protein CTC [Clostridium saccharobutylicum]